MAPVKTKTEFYQVNSITGKFEVPTDENIISVYIQNNSAYFGFISVNGNNQNDGLLLIPGKSLNIYGRAGQYLTGKIWITVLQLTNYTELSKIGILIKRKV